MQMNLKKVSDVQSVFPPPEKAVSCGGSCEGNWKIPTKLSYFGRLYIEKNVDLGRGENGST